MMVVLLLADGRAISMDDGVGFENESEVVRLCAHASERVSGGGLRGGPVPLQLAASDMGYWITWPWSARSGRPLRFLDPAEVSAAFYSSK